MKLGFCIVNYNQENELLLMLGSLGRVFGDGFFLEINVVDNSDTVSESLIGRFKKCLEGIDAQLNIIKKGNIGYLKGLQVGSLQLSSNCDFIFLCNPDLQFLSGPWLDILTRYRKTTCLLAPDITSSDGKKQNPNRLRRFSKVEIAITDLTTTSFSLYQLIVKVRAALKNIYRKVIGSNQDTVQFGQEIWQPHGSCMIVNVDARVLRDALNFDLFLWGEEAVIAGTLRRSGVPSLFDSRIKVKHDEHSSTQKLMPHAKFEIWRKSYAIYRDFLSD